MTTTDLTPAEVLRTAAARVRAQHTAPGDPKREFWYDLADWLDGCGSEYEYTDDPAAGFSLVPDPALAFARAVLEGDRHA